MLRREPWCERKEAKLIILMISLLITFLVQFLVFLLELIEFDGASCYTPDEEEDAAVLLRTWFLAGTCLYGAQLILALLVFCTGACCCRKAYDNCCCFWSTSIILPMSTFLANLSFMIFGTIIRFNSDGRRCSE